VKRPRFRTGDRGQELIPAGAKGRTVCTQCNNSGWIHELRLIWKQPREGMPPLVCSRRVLDQDHARYHARQLAAQGALDIDVVSAAKACSCRQKPESAASKPRKAAVASSASDFKRRAAGDFS
jgi:hypothetical protein